MDNQKIAAILEELREERDQASSVIDALDKEVNHAEANRGARKLLQEYVDRRNNIDAAVLAMDNLASGKRRGRRPGWINDIKEAGQASE